MVRKKNFLVSDMQFTEPERYKFIQHYDLHGIMKFQVRYNNNKNLIYNYNFPYSYFKVDHVDNPSIILNIAPFKPNNEECDVVFHNMDFFRGMLNFRESARKKQLLISIGIVCLPKHYFRHIIFPRLHIWNL
jgi:hypothetical protein